MHDRLLSHTSGSGRAAISDGFRGATGQQAHAPAPRRHDYLAPHSGPADPSRPRPGELSGTSETYPCSRQFLHTHAPAILIAPRIVASVVSNHRQAAVLLLQRARDDRHTVDLPISTVAHGSVFVGRQLHLAGMAGTALDLTSTRSLTAPRVQQSERLLQGQVARQDLLRQPGMAAPVDDERAIIPGLARRPLSQRACACSSGARATCIAAAPIPATRCRPSCGASASPTSPPASSPPRAIRCWTALPRPAISPHGRGSTSTRPPSTACWSGCSATPASAPPLRPLPLDFGRRCWRTEFVARRAAEDLEPFRLLEQTLRDNAIERHAPQAG